MLITRHGDIAFDEIEILKRKEDILIYIDNLRTAFQKNHLFDFDQLMKAYHFPKIMKQFHDGNVALMKKELRTYD